MTNLCSGNPEVINLCTDEIVFFRNLTKIGTDKNKAIYSALMYCFLYPPPLYEV